MAIKINAKVFEKRMNKLAGLPSYLVDEALDITKENTPVASGNARNKTIKKGNKILVDDGKLTLIVTKKNSDHIETRVKFSGFISSNKGFNIPNVLSNRGKLTDKDKEDLKLALKLGVDWIALSFVESAKDVLNFKKIIDQSNFPYNEITNLYFFPSKRWDLELRNNRIIKLSQNFTKESLELVLEFLHDNDFKDNKIVDARIKNQIILND